MAEAVLTQKVLLEKILPDAKPDDLNFKEKVEEYLAKYFQMEAQHRNSIEVTSFLTYFYEATIKHWRKHDRRLNRIFTVHKVFYQKVVNFDLENLTYAKDKEGKDTVFILYLESCT